MTIRVHLGDLDDRVIAAVGAKEVQVVPNNRFGGLLELMGIFSELNGPSFLPRGQCASADF